MSGPLTRATAAKVRQLVAAWPDQPGHAELEALMRWLAKWRSQALAQTFVGRHGAQIRSGLFAGMSYLPDASEGSLMARLLGTYEAELRPHIEALVAEGLDCVIDIGCAEGYYAVGLAYRFPNLEVFAFDIDETARTACAAASPNGSMWPVSSGRPISRGSRTAASWSWSTPRARNWTSCSRSWARRWRA
jgi:hypothetical protein